METCKNKSRELFFGSPSKFILSCFIRSSVIVHFSKHKNINKSHISFETINLQATFGKDLMVVPFPYSSRGANAAMRSFHGSLNGSMRCPFTLHFDGHTIHITSTLLWLLDFYYPLDFSFKKSLCILMKSLWKLSDNNNVFIQDWWLLWQWSLAVSLDPCFRYGRARKLPHRDVGRFASVWSYIFVTSQFKPTSASCFWCIPPPPYRPGSRWHWGQLGCQVPIISSQVTSASASMSSFKTWASEKLKIFLRLLEK